MPNSNPPTGHRPKKLPLWRLIKRLELRLAKLKARRAEKIRASRDPRTHLVRWAMWGVRNTAQIHYTETVARSLWLTTKPLGKLPISTDCSGFVTLVYALAGLPDPNGLNYKQLGYTGTLLSHAPKQVPLAQALPGDLIVYGPGTGAHVAIIVKAGADPLTVSHGDEQGPELVYVSQDGRQPQRVCRYL